MSFSHSEIEKNRVQQYNSIREICPNKNHISNVINKTERKCNFSPRRSLTFISENKTNLEAQRDLHQPRLTLPVDKKYSKKMPLTTLQNSKKLYFFKVKGYTKEIPYFLVLDTRINNKVTAIHYILLVLKFILCWVFWHNLWNEEQKMYLHNS